MAVAEGTISRAEKPMGPPKLEICPPTASGCAHLADAQQQNESPVTSSERERVAV